MNSTIANPSLIPYVPENVSDTGALTLTGLLQRVELLLRKAFGDDEATIANSLRGF